MVYGYRFSKSSSPNLFNHQLPEYTAVHWFLNAIYRGLVVLDQPWPKLIPVHPTWSALRLYLSSFNITVSFLTN